MERRKKGGSVGQGKEEREEVSGFSLTPPGNTIAWGASIYCQFWASFFLLCLCVLKLHVVDEAWRHGTDMIKGHQYKNKFSNPGSAVICEDPKSGGFGLKLLLELRTLWWSRVSRYPGGTVVDVQVPSTRGVWFFTGTALRHTPYTEPVVQYKGYA